MVIERQNDEIIIRLPAHVFNIRETQRLLDYFRFAESNAMNRGTAAQAAELAREIDANWWAKNKHRFLP